MNDFFGPDTHPSEEGCDQVGEGGLSDPSQSKTRQGDAELRRREIGIEILDGVLSSGRSPNPLTYELLYSRRPYLDDSELRSNEESIQKDEEGR